MGNNQNDVDNKDEHQQRCKEQHEEEYDKENLEEEHCTDETRNSNRAKISNIKEQNKNNTNELTAWLKRGLIKPNVTRCRDVDGFVGTVRYIGPVASASNPNEIYVGVEWDDVTRGKHDGSAVCRATGKRIRHFVCQNNSSSSRLYYNNSNENSDIMSSNNIPSSSECFGGSFVRPKKLDFGVSLTHDLLQSKYVDKNDPTRITTPDMILPNCFAQTAGGKEVKPIEFHGEIKLRNYQQLHDLDHVSLRCVGIAGAASPRKNDVGGGDGEENVLNDRDDDDDGDYQYPHLKSMDLAGNLLSDWKEVFAIMHQFPTLEKLSLAGNKLGNLEIDKCDLHVIKGKDKEEEEQSTTKSSPVPLSFDRIYTLNLKDCLLRTSQALVTIDNFMPYLNELCLAWNDLSDLDTFDQNKSDGGNKKDRENGGVEEYSEFADSDANVPSTTALMPAPLSIFQNLSLLDCSGCGLNSWERQVRRLRHLPMLRTLILDDNPIPSITTVAVTNVSQTDDDVDGVGFKSLMALQIANTHISQWTDLDGVSQLSQLQSLRFRNSPLTTLSKMGSAEVRATVIARIPQINILNASNISSKERIEAERRYVRRIARDLLMIENSTSSEYIKDITINYWPNSDNNNHTDIKGGEGEDADSASSTVEERRTAILSKHPRFTQLAEKYREAMLSIQASGVGTGVGSLAQKTINVTITSVAASSAAVGSNKNSLQKRLPTSITVGRLKNMCRRTYNVDVDNQVLYFCSKDDDKGGDSNCSSFPTELDDDDNPLSYYGVYDGAEIFMNEKS